MNNAERVCALPLTAKRLTSFLVGKWVFQRTITHAHGLSMGNVVNASATFSAVLDEPSKLLYSENGSLSLRELLSFSTLCTQYTFPYLNLFCFIASGVELSFQRQYLYDVLEGGDSAKLRVFFYCPEQPNEHLKFFHDLDLSSGQGEARHLCVNDLYSGSYSIDCPRRQFQTMWQVQGPNKDFVINTEYERDENN